MEMLPHNLAHERDLSIFYLREYLRGVLRLIDDSYRLDITKRVPSPASLGEALLASVPPVELREQAHRYFRWAYALLIALAKTELAKDNLTCGKNWPAGQQWDELVGTSHSIYLRRAREIAGIPHDEFLATVRGEEYGEDAEAVYDAALLAAASPQPAPQPEVEP